MAAVFELLDLSDFEYDSSLGYTTQDSGSGPPKTRGWIRNGNSLNGQFTSCGSTIFDAWTSANQTDTGSVMKPSAGLIGAPASGIPRWETQLETCDNAHRIWCVD